MTQEDKNLLLTDLSSRLPYGVIIHFNEELDENDQYFYSVRENGGKHLINDAFYIEEVKPYLRPMSSMTKEEKKEYAKLLFADLGGVLEDYYKSIDYLLKNHFDFRGLIPKGLAIAVTKENNPYE